MSTCLFLLYICLRPSCLGVLLGNECFSSKAMGNMDEVFILVGKTSSLTMNLAGVIKDGLLISLSWSVIKDKMTGINLLEYGLAFLGFSSTII